MFSYLRSHKRSGSQPSSPDVTSPPSSSFHLQPPSSSHSYHSFQSSSSPAGAEPPAFFNANRHLEYLQSHQARNESPISPVPPTLPPIPRIASVYDRDDDGKAKVTHARNDWQGSEARLHPRKGYKDAPADENTATREESSPIPHNSAYRPRGSQPAELSPEERYQSQMRSTYAPGGGGPPTGLRSRGQTAYSSRTEPESASTTIQNMKSPQSAIISPPSASSSHRSQVSPSAFPAESHRVPPRPPSSAVSTSSRPQTSSNASVIHKVEKLEKQGKRLNLRNPMSLLLRRRSGQVLEHLADESLVTRGSGSSLPDNFDPSIRGNVVHDFSAPRTRRNFSTSTLYSLGQESDGRRSPSRDSKENAQGPPRVEKPRTPIFKEHFDEDDRGWGNDAGIRAEQLANKDFISRNSFTPSTDEAIVLPPFARSKTTPETYQPVPPERGEANNIPTVQTELAPPSNFALLSPVAEDDDSRTAEDKPEPSRGDTQSMRRSGVATRSRATSRASAGDWQGAGLAHMLSKSSRFSFQLANVDSAAQERLLEERHMQRMAAKALVSPDQRGGYDEVEPEDEFDYDAMEYDGFEEDVPTVGDEWDYNGSAGVSNMSMGLGNLSLQDAARMALQSHPVGEMGGFTSMGAPGIQGLGISPSMADKNVAGEGSVVQQPAQSDNHHDGFEDDLYFDDGAIGDADFDDSQPFDESIFDDPTRHLYERTQPMPPHPEPSERSVEDMVEDQAAGVVPQNSRKIRRSKLPGDYSTRHPDPNASLETVSAYHQALAMAAAKAAAEGRFNRGDIAEDANAMDELDELPGERHVSAQYDEDDGVPNISSRHSLIPDEGRLSQATSSFSPPQPQGEELAALTPPSKAVIFSLPSAYSDDAFGSDFDMSDYDSALEEDPIIAAANAEALANDDEGFYGQEFGFYAKPAPFASNNDGDGVFFQGGYFGPKDWSEIKRRRSTREPNLTPITERSEYSTRNSFVSLPVAERMDRDLRSPGLAALARMSPSWDNDMNIETLMKLRRGAFGGSQGSLIAGTGGTGSSPLNASPIIPKDPRFLWSSPIGREVDVSEYDIDAGYEGMLDEANGLADEEDVGTMDSSGGNISPTSEYSNADADAESNFDSPDRTEQPIQSGSPTLRGIQPSSTPDTASPNKDTTPRQTPVNPVQQVGSNPASPPSSTTPVPNLSLQTANLPKPASLPLPLFSLGASTSNSTPFSPISPNNNAIASGTSSFAPTSPASPISATAAAPFASAKKRPSHSRSGSDSVAYVKERDEDGELRWVLERRRTGEDGGVEIVGRSVVEGGRI